MLRNCNAIGSEKGIIIFIIQLVHLSIISYIMHREFSHVWHVLFITDMLVMRKKNLYSRISMLYRRRFHKYIKKKEKKIEVKSRRKYNLCFLFGRQFLGRKNLTHTTRDSTKRFIYLKWNSNSNPVAEKCQL